MGELMSPGSQCVYLSRGGGLASGPLDEAAEVVGRIGLCVLRVVSQVFGPCKQNSPLA
jgi:hypothetical protein